MSAKEVANLHEKVTRQADGYMARCRAHKDDTPSLSVRDMPDGTAVNCFSGCKEEEILAAVNLTWRDLRPGRGGIEAVFKYHDEENRLLYEVVKIRKADGDVIYPPRLPGAGEYGIGDVRRVPYRLPELIAADPSNPVLIPEGEKDVETLRKRGFISTTNMGGASKGKTSNSKKWLTEFNGFFRDRDVVLLPDNDEPGKDRVQFIAESLAGIARSIRIVDLPGVKEKGDITDWLESGHTIDEFLALVEAAPFLGSRLEPKKEPRTEKHRESEILSIAELFAKPEEPITWVVDQLLMAGGSSIFAGKPKAGKTTATRDLAYCVAKGFPFLGRQTRQGSVLAFFLEENETQNRDRLKRLGCTGEEPIFLKTGSIRRPDAVEWMIREVQERRPSLVIVDPLFKLVRVKDGNAYTEVSAALEPLTEVARDTGAHVMFVHHLGKGEGTTSDKILGSTAIGGAFDTLLLLSRRDDIRYLKSQQRYGNDMPEIVINMDPETGSVTAGSLAQEVQQENYESKVLHAVQDRHSPLTEKEIRETVGGNENRVAAALRELVRREALLKTGQGKRGDPFLYSLPLEILGSRFSS